MLPTVTRRTWWKGALAVWSLASIAVSANFLGTKIVFGAIALYCLAAFIWQLVRLKQQPCRTTRIQAVAMGGTLLLTLLIFFVNSPLMTYLLEVYFKLLYNDPEQTMLAWGEDIQAAAKGTWLHTLLENNETLQRIDQVLSRRLLSSSPSVQVYTEGGILAKLLGIGYATAPSYSRQVYFMVEMDPLAMLVRHGVIGFLLYYVPYLAFLGWALVQCLRIPTIAGHALVCPAVATFVVVVGLELWNQVQGQNQLPKDSWKTPPTP